MDLLQECAKSFKSSLPFQYHIIAQPRYTLLKNEKVNGNPGEITVQFDRLSPKVKS